jgi:hypothetical protein
VGTKGKLGEHEIWEELRAAVGSVNSVDSAYSNCRHRSHFGSRYNLGCCNLAGLLFHIDVSNQHERYVYTHRYTCINIYRYIYIYTHMYIVERSERKEGENERENTSLPALWPRRPPRQDSNRRTMERVGPGAHSWVVRERH